MFIDILIRVISFLANLLILLIILNIALSYFMDPYHPLRQFVERIVSPMLNPIRKMVPLIGMFDISPIILVLLISVMQSALVNLLYTLR
ncbi:MAG TPA: YggT family protein [Anaerolineales bacterium]|nr:YggT family protein [Anaerolineales bacterium]